MIERKFDRNLPYVGVSYGRMSNDKQNPRSPDQQFDTINHEISIQQLKWRLLDPYRDDGISGRLFRKRPGLQRMLFDIRTRRIKPDLLLLDTRARLGREEEVAQIRRELLGYGVYIVTADSHFADPTTPEGKLYTVFDEARSEADNRTKAHDVLRGKIDAAKRGFWPGGKPPRGLKLKSKFIELDGVQTLAGSVLEHDLQWKWIVQMIFDRADQTGEGQTRLARFVNAHPDVPRKFLPIPGSSIGHMLDCELYYGDLHYPKHCTDIIDDVRVQQPNEVAKVHVVPEFCEPIVSRELWERVQEVRNARRKTMKEIFRPGNGADKHIRPVAQGVSVRHLLVGLARCAACGAAMRPNGMSAQKDPEGKYQYLRCPRNIDGICPNKQTVPIRWLTEAVTAHIKDSLFDGRNT